MKMVKRVGCILLAVVIGGLLVWKGIDFYTQGYARLLPAVAENETPPVDVDRQNQNEPDAVATDVAVPDTAVILDVPYLDQSAYPTGCESVSAVMLLRYWGVDVSVDEFIDYYLRCSELRQRNGQTYGPSPEQRFIGDPRENTGYGCYAPVIGRAVKDLLAGERDDLAVGNRCGQELSELAKKYIDRQVPVLIWATINMVEPYEGARWINPRDGSTVTWIANEHCLVLVGYDEDNYYCNDPYGHNGVIRVPRDLLERRYEQMGKQALIVHRVDG